VNYNSADYKWQQNRALYVLVYVIKGILLMLQERRQIICWLMVRDGARSWWMLRDGGGWCVMVRSAVQRCGDLT
jgi:hypothetical protein